MIRGISAAISFAAVLALAPVIASAQAPTSLLPSRPPPPGSTSTEPVLPSGLLGVEILQAPGGDSFGLLTGDQGMGADIWRGARRAQIVSLIALLPGATPSPTMNALTRKLLLTAAPVPPAVLLSVTQGADAQAATTQTGDDPGRYLALRIERLTALGDAQAAADLAAAAPGRNGDEAVLRASADAALLRGDVGAACGDIRAAVVHFADVYWRKALGFCQAVAGERTPAELTAATLREQGHRDAAYYELIAALNGDRNAKPSAMPNPTPLHVAMLRAAKLAAPADAYATSNPAVLAALAQASGPETGGAIDQRIAAAERAEATGALPTAALIKTYGELRFTEPQLANALTGSESESGPTARALLYAAQARQGAAAARAVLIQRALTLSQDAGLFATSARVYQDALASIPPTGDLAWFAASATRALFAAGRVREGRAWLAALGGGLGGVTSAPQETPPAVALYPYALLSPDTAAPWDAELWRRWLAAQGPLAQSRAALLLTLLEGLGRPAPEAAWDGLLRAREGEAGHLPSPAVMRTMEVSAATDRRGLAVAAALATLGPGGPAGCDPLVLGMALTSLRVIGFEPEARQLAIDAAVGNGL